MEFILSILTVLYTDLRVNYSDMLLYILQKLCKFGLFLIQCLTVPFLRLGYFNKRKQLPQIKDKVLLLSASQIARRIRNREISCEEVVNAYIQRCKDVNPVLNALAEPRFDAALREAREVDEFLKTNVTNNEDIAREKPLLGVPITVKQSIAVEGMSYTVGVKDDISERSGEDANIVKLIRKAGAIILLVSNTPEYCVYWETYNGVIGRTWNPYDTRRTAGGSSGGEAALLSSASSVLSLSSDIAGSARIPALFCGIFGHKPTPGWVPCNGHKPESSYKEWPLFFTMAPMTRYAEDIPLILKAISNSDVIRRRLDEKVHIKNMRFFYTEDNLIISREISTDTRQAIYKLKNHIERSHGVRVEKAKINEMKYSFNISSCMLLQLELDWIYNKKNPSSKNIFLEGLKFLFCMSSHTLPVILYGIATWITNKLPRKYHASMAEKQARLKKEFTDLLGDNGVLICPTFPSSAYYPYETIHNFGNFTHVMVYNALGLPVTQCPMGFDSNGLPMGLQIVANAGCDHLSIAVAQEIERVFGGWSLPCSMEKQVV